VYVARLASHTLLGGEGPLAVGGAWRPVAADATARVGRQPLCGLLLHAYAAKHQRPSFSRSPFTSRSLPTATCMGSIALWKHRRLGSVDAGEETSKARGELGVALSFLLRASWELRGRSAEASWPPLPVTTDGVAAVPGPRVDVWQPRFCWHMKSLWRAGRIGSGVRIWTSVLPHCREAKEVVLWGAGLRPRAQYAERLSWANSFVDMWGCRLGRVE
jgi:hypothetical protein